MPAPATTRPGPVLLVVAAAQTVAVASATIVAVALPDLARDLGASGSEQQWVVDAFVLVFASLLVAGGVLGDRHGRRRAFVLGLALFATGALLCTLAPSTGWLIAGRLVQGLGPPLLLPASLAIVTTAYTDPRARAKALGLWSVGSGLGVGLGPVAGGVLVETLDWRWVFAVNVPLALLLIAVGLRTIPDDRRTGPRPPFDAQGALLLTGAVAALTFGLIEGRGLGWTSPAVLGALGGAAGGLALFVRRERAHPHPLVEIGLFRHRPFVAANLAGAVVFGAFIGSVVFLSVVLQQAQGRGALETGLCLLPQGLGIIALAPVSGRLTARLGPRPSLLAGLALGGAGLVSLLHLEADTPYAELWWSFALLGAGTGIALPASTLVAVGTVEAARAGMASAIHNACRQVGQTLGIAILGTILFGATDLVEGLHHAALAGAAVVALAVVAVATLVPSGSDAPRPAGAAPPP